MPDAIEKLFSSPQKRQTARNVIHKLRIKRVTRNNPETVEDIKQWFPNNVTSRAKTVTETMAKSSGRGIPIKKRGQWRSGNGQTDGVYLTDQQKAKKLSDGANGFNRL